MKEKEKEAQIDELMIAQMQKTMALVKKPIKIRQPQSMENGFFSSFLVSEATRLISLNA